MFSDEFKSGVLNLFVPLCDKSKMFEEALSSKGLNLFYLIQNFEGQFDSFEGHYKYMIETGKEALGSSGFSRATLEDNPSLGYRSEYLSHLIEKRDESNGMDFESYRATRPKLWKLELDASRAKKLELQHTRRDDYEALENELNKRFKREQTGELCKLNELLGRIEGNILDKELLDSILSEILFVIGLEKNEKYSSKNYPVYTKELTAGCFLCCGIRNYDDVFIQRNFGIVELVFYIRDKKFKRSKIKISTFYDDKDSDRFIVLDINSIIPYYLSSYSHFSSIEELYLNVFAQARLFELVYSEVEKDVLEKFAELT
ncbi:hypothetical protein [Pseudoalteromonas rubra]|uniref:hypothetical protein n=1 Tax=Pseudoalteromonas rubra TaxID=43658 RepID=UPI002DB85CB5|nr:hypothetical protein [Pseudoalteromonas rubra]MEC4091370.1 hypothetical protein [Pseudoalteromonas rubra]